MLSAVILKIIKIVVGWLVLRFVVYGMGLGLKIMLLETNKKRLII